jgi:hypothetical protein
MEKKLIMMSVVDGLLGGFTLSYPFINDDGGRSKSRRTKQTNDCTVRALAIALNIPYDCAYDTLAGEGRKCEKGFHLQKWLNKQAWAEKIAFQAIAGQPRMNPAHFCGEYVNGRYICRVAKHVFAVVDGTVHDMFENRPNRCIYTAWKINLDLSIKT